MANSSMFTRPAGMNPARFMFATTVASYGLSYPLSIFEPHVHG